MLRLSRSRNKYGAVKSTVDGITFDSKGESECYLILKLLEKNGEIKLLDRQTPVFLTKAKIKSIPDFMIHEVKTGKTCWVEFKGRELAPWRIKKRLWEYYGPGDLLIYKKVRGRIELTERLRSLSEGSGEGL